MLARARLSRQGQNTQEYARGSEMVTKHPHGLEMRHQELAMLSVLTDVARNPSPYHICGNPKSPLEPTVSPAYTANEKPEGSAEAGSGGGP